MDEKDTIPVNNITRKNTPNDDEEILKQGDKDMEDTIKTGKENSRAEKNEISKDLKILEFHNISTSITYSRRIISS